MLKRNLIAVLASLALSASAACIGELEPIDGDPIVEDEVDDDPTPASPDAGVPQAGDDSEELFSLNVAPIVARCAGDACHSGVASSPLKFLGTGPSSEFYGSINQFPSVTGNYQAGLANLLLKIDAGNHYGQSYTAAERNSIVEWLAAEAVARNDADEDGTVDPPPVGDPFAVWAGCMTKANWDATEMYTWDNKESDEGPCENCHNDGAFRFNTNDNNDVMFEMNRTQLYIIGFFTVRVETDGTQTVIPAYDKIERMGNGTTLHPRFGYDLGDVHVQRLANFYDLTMQTKEAGLCGPAQYYQP